MRIFMICNRITYNMGGLGGGWDREGQRRQQQQQQQEGQEGPILQEEEEGAECSPQAPTRCYTL